MYIHVYMHAILYIPMYMNFLYIYTKIQDEAYEIYIHYYSCAGFYPGFFNCQPDPLSNHYAGLTRPFPGVAIKQRFWSV